MKKLTTAETLKMLLAAMTKEQDEHNEHLEIRNALRDAKLEGRRCNKKHYEKAVPAGYTVQGNANGLEVVAPSGRKHFILYTSQIADFNIETMEYNNAPYNRGALERFNKLMAIADSPEKVQRLTDTHNKMCEAYELLTEAKKLFGSSCEFSNHNLPIQSEFRNLSGFEYRIFDQLIK